jgi:hypothetical protein
VIVGWWGITATVATVRFWHWWLAAPTLAVAVGAVMIAGVALDWWPTLVQQRRKSRTRTPTHPPDPSLSAGSASRTNEERIKLT